MNLKRIYTKLFCDKGRVRLFALGAVAALFLTACGQKNPSSTADYIGIDAAKEAAFKAADISSDQATLLSAGLDSKNGTFYYQVVFQENGIEYEYDIDALTGVVIEEKHTAIQAEAPVNAIAANTAPAADGADANAAAPDAAANVADGSVANGAEANAADANAAAPDAATNAADGSAAKAAGTNAAAAGGAKEAPVQAPVNANKQVSAASGTGTGVDSNKAFSLALSHAGLTEADVMFHKVKEDIEDGKRVFEVEFTASNGTEYDYEISAADGTILSYDYDAEYQFSNPPAAGAGMISVEQAKQVVLERVPGASAENVMIQLEEDDGRMEYEGKLYYDNTEYEFKVDAYSGGLLEWEAESIRN